MVPRPSRMAAIHHPGPPRDPHAHRSPSWPPWSWPARRRPRCSTSRSSSTRQTFWDNRDWDWYKANIPFFECPDAGHRHDLLLPLGAAHQAPDLRLAEQRLLVHRVHRPAVLVRGATAPSAARPGTSSTRSAGSATRGTPATTPATGSARPAPSRGSYSTWLADAVWAVHRVHPDDAFVKDLLPDLVKNYEGWEKRHFVPDVGLFWQTGHDDGMEFNINSRQTQGHPPRRPRLPADAQRLPVGRRPGHRPRRRPGRATRRRPNAYRAKAAGLKENLQKKLWDPKRQFFFPMSKQDEEARRRSRSRR